MNSFKIKSIKTCKLYAPNGDCVCEFTTFDNPAIKPVFRNRNLFKKEAINMNITSMEDYRKIDNSQKITLSITKDHIRWIRYDIIAADMFCHIDKHPQKQMRELGINIIRAVPESIADCWMVLTDYQGELPEYISELELKLGEQYWEDWDVEIRE